MADVNCLYMDVNLLFFKFFSVTDRHVNNIQHRYQ